MGILGIIKRLFESKEVRAGRKSRERTDVHFARLAEEREATERRQRQCRHPRTRKTGYSGSDYLSTWSGVECVDCGLMLSRENSYEAGYIVEGKLRKDFDQPETRRVFAVGPAGDISDASVHTLVEPEVTEAENDGP